jgi:hypothetical protein
MTMSAAPTTTATAAKGSGGLLGFRPATPMAFSMFRSTQSSPRSPSRQSGGGGGGGENVVDMDTGGDVAGHGVTTGGRIPSRSSGGFTNVPSSSVVTSSGVPTAPSPLTPPIPVVQSSPNNNMATQQLGRDAQRLSIPSGTTTNNNVDGHRLGGDSSLHTTATPADGFEIVDAGGASGSGKRSLDSSNNNLKSKTWMQGFGVCLPQLAGCTRSPTTTTNASTTNAATTMAV